MQSGHREVLRVGTRESALARLQTDLALSAIKKHVPDLCFEIVTVKTSGDKVLNKPLSEIGSRGVFVKELEDCLLEGKVDLVVHSLKDVPALTPPGLVLGATLLRADPRDVLVSNSATCLADLKAGSRIATSSRRRSAQLLSLRPDLEFVDIRGNIQTRLRKHDQGECDAMVLAAAGLLRLGLHDRIAEYFSPQVCMPAPGQGALCLECREDDLFVADILKTADDKEIHSAIKAERAFLHTLGGGCSVPVGALAVSHDDGTLELSGCIASLDGKEVIRKSLRAPQTACEDIGSELALQMLAEGAAPILASLTSSTPGQISPP